MGRKVHPIGFRLNVIRTGKVAGSLKAPNTVSNCTRILPFATCFIKNLAEQASRELISNAIPAN